MARHPDAGERHRIRLTQWILTAVGLATVIVIIVLALRGNFSKAGTAPPASLQQHK
jgi:hypothetical protein